MSKVLRWTLGAAIAAFILVAPFVYFRAEYARAKRLREVAPGVLYRSGQLTQEGFAEVVRRYGIRTIVNVQDDYPDPVIARSYLHRDNIQESELCRRLGVRYLALSPDLVPRNQLNSERPTAIDDWLDIMDFPGNYPVLIHCKAGLHRTGVLVAVYRMEYQGWTAPEAVHELKANGFGEFVCSASNDYITQYILKYRPHERRGAGNPPRAPLISLK